MQGALAGSVIAALLFLAVEQLRGEPEPIETAYSTVEPHDIGAHRLGMVRLWDIRQPSSIPGLPGPGGDRYISMAASMDLGYDSTDWVDLRDLDITVYAVDDDSEREALEPTADTRRTLDELSGVARDGEPFWLRLVYEPPQLRPRSYELVLEIDGEEHTIEVPDEEEL